MRKRIYRNKRELLLFVVTAIVVLAYLYYPQLFSDIGFAPFGVAALIIGYFSGAIAIIVGLFYTLLALVAGIPIISTVCAFIIFSLARIHYSIMQWLTFRVLNRVRWYQEAKLKVKQSRAYGLLKRAYNGVLVGSGVADPHPLKVFKIRRCISCGEDIPLDSIVCPYCGRGQ